MNKYYYSPLSSFEQLTNFQDSFKDTETLCSDQSYCSKFLDLFPELTFSQRMTGFAMTIIMGIICFLISFLYIPVLIFKTRKFALLFTLGSLFVLSSFFFLNGPKAQFKSLLNKDRLIYTATYFITLLTTLYTSLWLKSTLLTLFASVAQVVGLFCYLLSILPGGMSGFKFLTKMFTNVNVNSLPV